MSELQRIIDGPWITPHDRLCLRRVQAELTRLRGIEEILRSIAKGVDDEPETDFRNMAMFWRENGWPFRAMVCDSLADALEAIP